MSAPDRNWHDVYPDDKHRAMMMNLLQAYQEDPQLFARLFHGTPRAEFAGDPEALAAEVQHLRAALVEFADAIARELVRSESTANRRPRVRVLRETINRARRLVAASA